MNGQWIFIQAQDVWMFRDSKPFSAQQNFVAHSQFPPNPQTMQGVIRSHYLESQGVNWRAYAAGGERAELYEAVGHAEIKAKGKLPTMGSLKISGPFIAHEYAKDRIQKLIHAPLDLLENKTSREIAMLKPSQERPFESNPPFPSWMPLVLPGTSSEEDYKSAAGWLTEAQFVDYLQGQPPIQAELIENKDVYEGEDRIGLGMDHGRRAAEQSLLYRAHFIRPHDDIGLLMHINQPLLDDSGFIRIGGESRSARFKVIKDYAPPEVPVSGQIKIVLLTPAYFSGGWHPQDHDWSAWVGGGRLMSAVLGKPMTISGWDIANNRAKPLRHYLPAGSVFYFENAEYTAKPFTETPADEADFGAMGFGSIAVGSWKYSTPGAS